MSLGHAPTARVRSGRGDDGSVMPMAVVLITALVFGGGGLVSGSQLLAARRDAYAVAAAAARAAAQADPEALRGGVILDPYRAEDRARQVLAASGHQGSVEVDGVSVTVVVTAGVSYVFPAPGLARTVTGTATASARRGVTGQEVGG